MSCRVLRMKMLRKVNFPRDGNNNIKITYWLLPGSRDTCAAGADGRKPETGKGIAVLRIRFYRYVYGLLATHAVTPFVLPFLFEYVYRYR